MDVWSQCQEVLPRCWQVWILPFVLGEKVDFWRLRCEYHYYLEKADNIEMARDFLGIRIVKKLWCR